MVLTTAKQDAHHMQLMLHPILLAPCKTPASCGKTPHFL